MAESVRKAPLVRRAQAAARSRLVTGCALALRACQVSTRHPPQPVLWVLGHMRAGTSLLLHLLLTNSRLGGIGERNRAYHTELDLERLVADICLERRTLPNRFQYVIDQINHSQFTPNERLFDLPRVRVLMIVREPTGTIASIRRLTRDFYTEWSCSRATEYYEQRLASLQQWCSRLADSTRCYGITYSQLIHQTGEVLRSVQEFLGLKSGFQEEYSLHAFSGRRGDPSATLRAGRVVRDKPPCPLSKDLAGDELLPMPRAWARYEACVASMNSISGVPGGR